MPHCPALAQPNRQGTIPLEPESISGRLRLSRTMGKAGTMAFSDGCPPPFRHRGSVTSVRDLPPAPADAADAARCLQVAVSLHRSAQRKQISLSLLAFWCSWASPRQLLLGVLWSGFWGSPQQRVVLLAALSEWCNRICGGFVGQPKGERSAEKFSQICDAKCQYSQKDNTSKQSMFQRWWWFYYLYLPDVELQSKGGERKGAEQISGDQKIPHDTQSNKLCCQQTQLPLDLSKDKTTIVYI